MEDFFHSVLERERTVVAELTLVKFKMMAKVKTLTGRTLPGSESENEPIRYDFKNSSLKT